MNVLTSLLLKYKSNSSNIHAIAIRYGLYAFGLLDSLLLPKLIDKDIYSDYEYLKNAILLFPNLMLGAYSGLLFVKFSLQKDMYSSLFIIGFIISLLGSLVVSIILDNYLLVLPLLFMNLFVIFEQKLKLNKEYIKAFAFKPLISIFVLLFGILIYFTEIGLNANLLIFLVFNVSFLIWLILVHKSLPKIKLIKIKKKWFRVHFKNFKFLVEKFATGSLAGLIYLLLLFFERYLVSKYYPEFLAEYSFVFNMSQIMVIVLSVFSYISSVEFGERIETIKKVSLLEGFKSSLLYFICFFCLYLISIYLIGLFYSEFPNLFWMTVILALSKGFFFFVGIYSPIAVYKNFNTPMLKTISAIFLINVICAYTLVFQGFSIIYLLLLNAALIITYSLYILDIVFRRINYIKE